MRALKIHRVQLKFDYNLHTLFWEKRKTCFSSMIDRIHFVVAAAMLSPNDIFRKIKEMIE